MKWSRHGGGGALRWGWWQRSRRLQLNPKQAPPWSSRGTWAPSTAWTDSDPSLYGSIFAPYALQILIQLAVSAYMKNPELQVIHTHKIEGEEGSVFLLKQHGNFIIFYNFRNLMYLIPFLIYILTLFAKRNGVISRGEKSFSLLYIIKYSIYFYILK